MTTTPVREPARWRWLRFIALPLLAAAVVAVSGCGGSDKPAVCGSLDTLTTDVDQLKSIDPKAEGAMDELETSFDSIRTDLEAVKADASEELSQPIAGLKSSLDALSAKVDAARTQGSVSPAAAQGISESLAAVSTSWETLKSSAPDC